MGPWCVPWYIPRHFYVTRGLVQGAPEHAMVYSMMPDDTTVDISPMGQHTKKCFHGTGNKP